MAHRKLINKKGCRPCHLPFAKLECAPIYLSSDTQNEEEEEEDTEAISYALTGVT